MATRQMAIAFFLVVSGESDYFKILNFRLLFF